MQLTVRKNYDDRYETFELIHEFKFAVGEEDLEKIYKRYFNTYNIETTIRESFNIHEELYKEIDEKFIQDRYSPNSSYYNGQRSRGYSNFIEDMTDEHIKKYTEIICDLLFDKYSYLDKLQRSNGRYTLVYSFPEKEDKIHLDEIDVKIPSTININGKTYSMELKQLENIIEPTDLERELYTKLKDEYKEQMKIMKEGYERRIKVLMDRFEKDKNELFAELLKYSVDIFKSWEFVEENDELWLKYKNRITTNRIAKNGIIYEYPEDQMELYVSGLRVKVIPTVTDMSVKVSRGKNLHFNGSSGCIGDLSGKPLIEVLRELPHSLEIANMDSPLNNEVQYHLRGLFANGIIEEIKEEEEQESSWTSSSDSW